MTKGQTDEARATNLRTWQTALTRQQEIWESFELVAQSSLSEQASLKAPSTGFVASLPLAEGAQCMTGEVVMYVQPKAPVVRLWQLAGDHTIPLNGSLNFKMMDDRFTSNVTVSHQVNLQQVGSALVPLPDSLQPYARRVLMTSSLLTIFRNEPPPTIYGTPIKIHLTKHPNQPNHQEFLWGSAVQVIP